MKIVKFNTVFLLASTFVLGMVIGGLLMGRLTHARVAEMQETTTTFGFQKAVLESISPDGPQAAEITPIIHRFAERMDAMHVGHFAELAENCSLLEESLQAYLQPKQVIGLQHFLRQIQGK